MIDIDGWFAELDRCADVPFTDEGRAQPPMPTPEGPPEDWFPDFRSAAMR